MTYGKTIAIETQGFSDVKNITSTVQNVIEKSKINNGSLSLEKWQQIIVVDHDNRPRSRNVRVQVIGE